MKPDERQRRVAEVLSKFAWKRPAKPDKRPDMRSWTFPVHGGGVAAVYLPADMRSEDFRRLRGLIDLIEDAAGDGQPVASPVEAES